MHTSSYEQLYNNHPKTQRDIRELRGTQLPSIVETMPKLPGHKVSENNKMLPDFMSALATLPGARSGTYECELRVVSHQPWCMCAPCPCCFKPACKSNHKTGVAVACRI